MTRPVTLALIALFFCTRARLGACSLQACIDDGDEMRHEFDVLVKFGGKPLEGVRVDVTSNGTSKFSGYTGADGRAHVVRLTGGNYWLRTDFLGLGAGSECFHVLKRESGKAKHRLNFEWGDYAPAVRHLSGTLIDSEPGKRESPLWNLIHRIDLPIVGASIKAQRPVDGVSFETTTDQRGYFSLGELPQGKYVLHAEGGRSDRPYDATDILIDLNPKGHIDHIVLMLRGAGGGGCGGTSLELNASSNGRSAP